MTRVTITQVDKTAAFVIETDGLSVLLSYGLPVAARISGVGWVRTENFHSRTTTKHINAWVPTVGVRSVPQHVLTDLLVLEANLSVVANIKATFDRDDNCKACGGFGFGILGTCKACGGTGTGLASYQADGRGQRTYGR